MSDSNTSSSTSQILVIITIVIGAVFMVSGVGAWFAVSSQLADENITVADDAGRFAGQPVDGPLTAYEQANVINKHALEATGGKTYAELDRDDPARQTAMTASFLRASLFTSVVAFGVAAMAFGIGLALVLLGTAMLLVRRQREGSA
ncbi:MAG: aromatic ring-opening dioxygenase LigA [Acidimicrobiia bacterium]